MQMKLTSRRIHRCLAWSLSLMMMAGPLRAEDLTPAAVAAGPGGPRVRPVLLPDFPAEGAWHANHEMRLRSDGNLPGQLRTFDATGNMAPVRGRLFFVQNNQIVGRALTDDLGNFQMIKLEPGTYSVVAANSDGFSAFSMRISTPTQQSTPPRVKSIAREDKGKEGKGGADAKAGEDVDLADVDERVFDGLTMQITLVPAGDLRTIGKLIGEHVPEMRAYFAQAVTTPDIGSALMTPRPAPHPKPVEPNAKPSDKEALHVPGPGPVQGRLTGLLLGNQSVTLARHGVADGRDLPETALPEDGPWFADHAIHVSNDGHVRGQLRTFTDASVLVSAQAKLFFIRGGIAEAAGETDAHGRFDLSGVEPGIYSVLAASSHGLGMFAIRILPAEAGVEPPVAPLPEPQKPKGADDRKVPAQQTAFRRAVPNGSLFVSLASPSSFSQIANIAMQNTPTLANSAGGGLGAGAGLAGAGAGGVGAAGAAVGGAGGAGALGSLGGIAAGVGALGAAAAAGKNNSTTSTTSSSSSSSSSGS